MSDEQDADYCPHPWPCHTDCPVPCAGPTAERGCTAIRPNGKVYRARREPDIEFCMWNDGAAVLCSFTHDVERVREAATALWGAEVGTDMPEPLLIWIKKVPWDALGMGFDSTIMGVSGNTKGSTPAVIFGDDVHESEVAIRPACSHGAVTGDAV